MFKNLVVNILHIQKYVNDNNKTSLSTRFIS